MKVSPRRASREFALQGMYQWLFTQATPAQILKNLAELEGFAQADGEFLKDAANNALLFTATDLTPAESTSLRATCGMPPSPPSQRTASVPSFTSPPTTAGAGM